MATIQPLQPSTTVHKIERQYSKFVAQRYIAFVYRVALWIILVLSSSVSLVTGDLSKVPLAIVSSAPVFVSLALLLRIRKSYITQPYRPPPSTSLPRLFASALWNERAVALLSSYVSFSLITSNAWCTIVGDPDHSLFNATQRYPWQLNEDRVILVISNMCLLLVIASRDILDGTLNPVWPKHKRSLAKAVQSALLNKFWSSTRLKFTLLWSLAAPFAYCWLGIRSHAWRWVNWRLWAVAVRPMLGSFTRSTNKTPGPWALLWPMLVLNFVTLILLQLPAKAMTAYVTQPIYFDELYRKSPLTPERYLITALQSSDTYSLQFTLMELLRIVNVPERRKALFDDISQTPNITIQLWQELLVHFGRVHQTLITRGSGPSGIKQHDLGRTISTMQTNPDPRAMPVRQADIFRPVTKAKSAFNLKSVLDGPVRSTAPSPVKRINQISSVAVKRVEGVHGQVVGKIEGTPVGNAIVGEAKIVKKGINEWAGREWASRAVNTVLGEVLLAQRVIDIMITLAIASVQEDTYGNVQQVLPATLEAIVRFTDAVSVYESQMIGQTRLMSPTGQESAVAELNRQLGGIVNHGENAIRLVGDTFGQSLGAFKFPPSIGHRLGEICKR